MGIGLTRLVRSAAMTTVALVAAAAGAGAQVQVTFYDTFPAAPNPLAPFVGGAVLCSNSAVGTSSGGFSLDFGDAATRTALCPSNADRLAPGSGFSYGARFTGALNVAAGGVYEVNLSTDDGDALAVNGVVVRTDWVNKASGPGLLQLTLNAGLNPFVLDFYQGPCCGSFATLLPGQGVTINPPPPVTTTAPEPSSFALTGVGALVIGGLIRRRRRATIA